MIWLVSCELDDVHLRHAMDIVLYTPSNSSRLMPGVPLHALQVDSCWYLICNGGLEASHRAREGAELHSIISEECQ